MDIVERLNTQQTRANKLTADKEQPSNPPFLKILFFYFKSLNPDAQVS